MNKPKFHEDLKSAISVYILRDKNPRIKGDKGILAKLAKTTKIIYYMVETPRGSCNGYYNMVVSNNLHRKDSPFPYLDYPEQQKCELGQHNFEDVPTIQMLGLRQCVKCGKVEVK